MRRVLHTYITGRMPNDVHAQRFLSYVQRRLAEATYVSYRKNLCRFLECTPEITPETIEDYLQALLNSGLKAKTVNTHFGAIQSYCKFLYDFYDIPNAASRIKKLLEKPPPRRNLTEDEYLKLIRAAGDELPESAIIPLLANTGIRIGEVKTFEPAGKVAYVMGKGSKRRAVPVNQIVQELIGRNVINLLKTYSYRGLHQAIWRCCEKAGVPKCSPHDFRHFFANSLRRKGVSVFQISKALGHSSVRITTEIYQEWLDDDVAGLADCLVEPPQMHDG